MRKSHLLAVVAAVIVVAAGLLSMTLSGSDAAAQSPVRPQMRPQVAPPVVALLDVSYVFKKHARLKLQMDEMKKEVDRAENWVRTESETLTKLLEQLKTFHTGSPDYKSLEARIAKRRADLAVQVAQQKREFLRKESSVYYGVYQEIQYEVNDYCRAKQVAVVLRFSREPVDVERPESVLAYINKPVITYSKDLDISDLILAQLNRRGVAPPGGNPNVIGGRPRPGVPFK